MKDPLHPGVYVEETRNLPTITELPTSTAVFVGAHSGGGNAERFHTLSEAEALLENLTSATGLSIRQFFANGGQDCWFIPVAEAIDNSDRVAAIRDGIAALDQLERFNLLCIPETSDLDPSLAAAAIKTAGDYCERRRAFLLVDPPQILKTPRDIITWVDGTPSVRHRNAALYYPLVRVQDASGAEHTLAPSSTMAGVIARTDGARGVWRSPAGTEAVLNGVIALERLLTQADNESLNRKGINCLREFVGIGRVCWGARTLSTDPEWKYVPLRRLLMHLEASIDKGLEWVVFEPNDEPLWAKVRTIVASFLTGLWRRGAFQGATAKEAFFVNCGRSSMTQSDIDNGRLVVEIGVAALKPAEYVIFRIGQWTASKK